MPLNVPSQPFPEALPILKIVANYAADLIGAGLVETVDGQLEARTLGASDICVVVAHNAQTSGLRAILKP
ncbi:hypothetical protein SAMN05660473_00185 [Arthrobacter sp. 49Tsu3.1M3]|uniref:hypothetical protein n=1 Tax=Arthrobacter sp. 49Tsu3.1M3 TaxID=1279029 RepID=UPI0009A8E66E|nr:hypothetical protein [Arthrobacter sp. 49Tsu3.1M3]SKB33900.1 hypothetical protein SAMN05660473_00185 [Arthrobacter sp. 49Tsu3.1M3]